MIRVAFIIHSRKKLTSANQKLIQNCERHRSIETSTFYTNKSENATQFALLCSNENIDYIIAVGGDGTVNEVINGIMLCEGNKPIFGVLPNGSGNDYVKSARLQLDKTKFISSLLDRNYRLVDVGTVKTEIESRFFINIADIGFGGAVINTMQESSSSWMSSYAFSILKTFRTFHKPTLTIHSLEKTITTESLMITICIGGTFGNGLIINPHASTHSGILNITLIGNVSIWDYIKYIFKLRSGKTIQHPEVQYWQSSNITIKTERGQVFAEIDGELINGSTFEFTILPASLRLLHY